MAGDSASDVTASASGAVAPDAVLDLCDRLLEEVGRRQHRFAWLRTPGAAAGEWLPVDAYYPARRLVVVVDGRPPFSQDDDALYAELIPAHGLRLLRIDLAALGSDPAPVLQAQIADLELPPREVFDRSVGQPEPRETAMSRVSASLVQATAPPVRQRVRPSARGAHAAAAAAAAGGPGAPRVAGTAGAAGAAAGPDRRSDPALALGVVVGVALVITLGIELFAGIGELALGGQPHWVLAFGLALDAVARVLGTVAGERSGRLDWSLWSMIGGSPAVAAITLFRRDGRMTTEPGPIAGLMAVAAMAFIGLWVAGALLGV